MKAMHCSVEGGDDKSTEKFYNPLYFSDDPFGGYMKLSADERKVCRRLERVERVDRDTMVFTRTPGLIF